MQENVNKLRTYFYLFVMLSLLGFLIAYVIKNPNQKIEKYTICSTEKVWIPAPWPADLVPHIRELEENEQKKPKDIDCDDWQEYKKRKKERENIV